MTIPEDPPEAYMGDNLKYPSAPVPDEAVRERLTLEDRLAKWLEQPATFVTTEERRFIHDMRLAAQFGVGYGWMQQVIEWEWQSKGPGAWGPEYFEADRAALRDELEQARKALAEVKRLSDMIGDPRQWIQNEWTRRIAVELQCVLAPENERAKFIDAALAGTRDDNP